MDDRELSQRYRSTAQRHANDKLEVDMFAEVSFSDGGAWVHAWVWVSNEAAEITEDDLGDHA